MTVVVPFGGPMLVTFGKHQGRTVEELVLKEPDYVVWMLMQPNPAGAMARTCHEARRLIGVFDDKPFLGPCSGRDCPRPATRCSVYGQNIQPVCWCDDCDPYSMGASQGRLQIITGYGDAVRHVGAWCDSRKSDLK